MYLFRLCSQLGDDIPVEEAFEKMNILAEGDYAKNLGPFFQLFPRSQIHILFFDQLKSDPEGFVESLYRFIGAEPTFKPDVLHRRVWATKKPRVPALAHLAYSGALLTRRLGMPNLVGRLKHMPLLQGLLFQEFGKKPEMDPVFRKKLQDYYRPGLNDLEDLLGRPIPPAWRA